MTPRAPDILLFLHILFGIVIIDLAYYNFNGVQHPAFRSHDATQHALDCSAHSVGEGSWSKSLS